MKTRLILPLTALLLSGFAHAQDAPKGAPAGTSKSDFAAQSVFDRINRELAKRSDHPEDPNAVGDTSLHIVFLMDSSQYSAKDFLPVFEKKVISGILRRIGAAQLQAKASDNDLDTVSAYPYQLHLIQDPKWTATNKLLKKGEGAVEAVIDKIPTQRVPVTGEGLLGHDSSGARSELIKSVNSGSGGGQTLVIQMSPTSGNSDPSNHANNEKLVATDARAGLLDGTGYVVYDDDGRYYQTDPPGSGVPASDVHIWVYGPSQVKEFAKQTAAPAPAAKADRGQQDATPPPAQSSGLPVGLIAVVAVLLAAIGYVIYRFTAKFSVELDGEIARVGFNKAVSIVVSGGKVSEGQLQISPQASGSVGPGLKVGQITVPLLAGGPKVGGAGGHTLYLLNGAASELPITKKPTKVSFGKGDSRTEQVSLKLR